MKAIIEVSTSPADTDGETPVAVVIMPKTIHGCRPVSVKIQPKLLANNGSSGGEHGDRTQQPRGCRDVRPLRVDHSDERRRSAAARARARS